MAADRFVVTGSGHSGTAWLAMAFSFLGIPSTHEGIYTLRGPYPWPDGLRGDVSLAAMPYLDGRRFAALIVVRDPLAVLNSFLRTRSFAATCPCHPPGAHLGSLLVRFVRMHGFRPEADEVGTVIRYIVGWHERGVTHAPSVKLEDLVGGGLVAWARELADVPEERTRALLAGPWLPADVNAHGPEGDDRPPLTWADVDRHRDGALLRRHAERAGYV